ncbi:IS1096 element passenger TnpR family protein [Spirosoma areae]
MEVITPDGGLYRHPRCLEGKRACPPEETGGPTVYSQQLDAQRDWVYGWLDTLVERLQAGENPLEDNVPAWYFTHQPERFDLKAINGFICRFVQNPSLD